MKALSTHSFQPAADSSSGILFSPDIFDCDMIKNSARTENEARSLPSPIVRSQTREGARKQEATSPHVKTSRKAVHAACQDPQVKRRLSSIRPVFRQRPASGRAGDVAALDDRIARNGETTSTYEQLPHRLQISKHHRPITPAERI